MSRFTKAGFWAQTKRDENDCILWTGKRYSNGYGRVGCRGEYRLTHRVAYEMTHGEIPAGLCVLHACDVRNCVNPAHLWLGTVADNLRDAAQKGRMRNGNTGKTHCKRGHEFTPENTGWNDKGRNCKRCKVDLARERMRTRPVFQSRYTGVSWSKSAQRWRAGISIGCKQRHLGLFDSEEQAAAAYAEARQRGGNERRRLATSTREVLHHV